MTPQRIHAAVSANNALPWLAKKIAGVIAFFCAAGMLFIALVVLWLGQTSQQVYRQAADNLVIRAVLRTDTDSVAAEGLAERIRQQVPDAGLEVINEAMGRSILALQEPWIAQMPDFEVTPLPVLLEVRHPNLLTHPTEVAGFVEELEMQPEVDFVTYNEAAHDRLVKLAAGTARIEKHSLRWLLGAVVLAGFTSQFICMLIAAPGTVVGAYIKPVIIWLCAWAFTWIVYRSWETAALETGGWQRLTEGVHLSTGIAAGVLILCASLAGWSARRFLR